MFGRCTVAGLFTLGALALSLAAGKAGAQKADETNAAKKAEEGRKGVVTGVVTAKGENWIDMKGDGEEKARRYVPHWRGGAPADGGGPDKEMVARIKELTEEAKVAVRNVRRDGNKMADQSEKDKELSEDDRDKVKDDIQELTKRFENQAGDMAKAREKDVMED